MKRNSAALLLLVATALVTGLIHIRAARRVRERATELNAFRAQLDSRLKQADEFDRALAELRLTSQSSVAPVEPIGKNLPEAAPVSPPPSRMQLIADDPKLRVLYVRAFVNQRDLAFARLFRQLNFDVEQRQRFDAIEAKYQQGLLDCAQLGAGPEHNAPDSSVRQRQRQITAEEQDSLGNLFGSAADQWKEFNRTLGARQLTAQVLQQNLQGADPFDESSAERLTNLLAAHRAAAGASPDSLGYDWESIFPLAQASLTPSQWAGFQTSVKYLRTQAQVNALEKQK